MFSKVPMPFGEVRVGGDVISLGSVAWEDRVARDLTLNDLRYFHPGMPVTKCYYG